MSQTCVTIETRAHKIQTYTSTMWNSLPLFPYNTHACTHSPCGFHCCCFPIRVLSSPLNLFRFPSLFLSASVFVSLENASFVRTIGCHGDSLVTHKTVSMEHTHTHTYADFTLVPTVLLYERIIERMKGERSSTRTPVIERLSVIFIKYVVLCVNVGSIPTRDKVVFNQLIQQTTGLKPYQQSS